MYHRDNMMSNAVNQKPQGIRCRICTGCGLCPGVIRADSTMKSVQEGSTGLQVLVDEMMIGGELPLSGKDGMRLVTVDVGTTTIAMLLYGSDGSVADRYVSVNPQTRYGADVISRIHAAQKAEQALEMRRQVEQVLERGIRRFQKHLTEKEQLQMVLAANTAMTYLLMGWETGELGHAPFHAEHLAAVDTVLAGVPCFIFPRLSAFVGGDIAAGIHACGMADRQELILLVDLGTNGELVIGNRDRRIACATAAGPAFEGGANRGIWGADMVSLLARLRQEGILDETGLLAEEFFEKGVRIGNVLVTQESVRSIQLAKAAIAAGIEILLNCYGAEAEQVDRLVLAGGFGYYLQPAAAAEIGLLPDRLASKSVTGGNTALAGALCAGRELIMGKREQLMAEMQRIAAGTEIVNLAMQPEFEERYVAAMKINKNK